MVRLKKYKPPRPLPHRLPDDGARVIPLPPEFTKQHPTLWEPRSEPLYPDPVMAFHPDSGAMNCSCSKFQMALPGRQAPWCAHMDGFVNGKLDADPSTAFDVGLVGSWTISECSRRQVVVFHTAPSVVMRVVIGDAPEDRSQPTVHGDASSKSLHWMRLAAITPSTFDSSKFYERADGSRAHRMFSDPGLLDSPWQRFRKISMVGDSIPTRSIRSMLIEWLKEKIFETSGDSRFLCHHDACSDVTYGRWDRENSNPTQQDMANFLSILDTGLCLNCKLIINDSIMEGTSDAYSK